MESARRNSRGIRGGRGGGGAEFAPEETQCALDAFDRRTFLRLMGAGFAAAGVAGLEGCTSPQPAEKIVPYVDSPESLIPGVPRFYASALPTGGWIGGYGRGVIVEQHEGRPTKIEGNPDHPSSLGATDIFMQASVLQLYDPDRSKALMHGHDAINWSDLLDRLRRHITRAGGAAKLHLRLLTGTLTSPALVAAVDTLKQVFPNFSWHVHDVLASVNARQGQRRALGRAVTPVLDLTRARRIVSLDAHFLAEEAGTGGGSVRYARALASRRRLPFQSFGPNQTHRDGGNLPAASLTPDQMNRLYVAESAFTFSGVVADHRLPVAPAQMPVLAVELARAISGKPTSAELSGAARAWLAATVADLKAAGPEGLLLVGEYQPPEVHALGYAINSLLGNIGSTLSCREPVEGSPDNGDSLAALVNDMNDHTVDLLLILETNPAYTAPADIPFAEALAAFSADPDRLALHAGGYADETAALCGLHVPLSHPLEAWGDVRAHDGTISLIQPLIRPLWASKSALEILSALTALALESTSPAQVRASMSDLFAEGYDLLHRFWMDRWKNLSTGDQETQWRQALQKGIVPGTASPAVSLTQTPDLDLLLAECAALARPAAPGAIDLVFRPDPTIGDGAWANHPWLQELPKPLSHMTWDTLAILSPATARTLGINQFSYESRGTLESLRIQVGGHAVELPAWVQPGHADGVVALYLGGGRRSAGNVQQGVGVDVYPLRTSRHLWSASTDVHVTKGTRTYDPACTQPELHTEGRDIVRARPVTSLHSHPTLNTSPDLYSSQTQPGGRSVHLSLYDERLDPGYKWGMVVDLSACIGCSACVVACQAENNSPTVGREQVRLGREMHWIRIDTYWESRDSAHPDEPVAVHFQPMFCQHCENAPCEVVCPVEATSHSDEGINEMTYNRCIGTRYCSNNCPYKVRRFNFLHFTAGVEPPADMQRNPNVTVRSRGVMEKCTYCIQRINRARINAKRAWARQETSHGAPVEMRTSGPDGWTAARDLPRLRLQTACQQACPTSALIFGDLNDTAAFASILKKQQPWAAIDYGVLTELNTQPRTSYLERITNPHPGRAAPPGGAA